MGHENDFGRWRFDPLLGVGRLTYPQNQHGDDADRREADCGGNARTAKTKDRQRANG